ncbi:hypothetical protein Droror1_Dr00022509 [Drosera rotundifolia]
MQHTTNHFISLFQRCKTLTQLKQLQALISKSGLESDPFILGKLILTCSISLPGDSLNHAAKLLLHAPSPDTFMYNTVSRGLSESDNPNDAIKEGFVEMRRRSLVPDSFSFAFNLKATANLRALRVGIQVHCQVLGHGFGAHLFVGTTMVSMYGECRCFGDARKVFDEISERNVVAWNAVLTACFRGGDVGYMRVLFDGMPFRDLTSWNVMLSGYMKAGDIAMASRLFLEMPMKDDVSWSTMVVGLAQSGCFEDAFVCFMELRENRVEVNEACLTGVLSACAQAGAYEVGRILHAFVEKAGFGSIVSVNNSLLDTYARCGYVEMARLVFETMADKRSVLTWTSMISGLAMQGHGKEAIKLFGEMEEHGVMPDEVVFISVMYACSHAGLIEEGCQYFDIMAIIYGFQPAMEHYGCMVDLYGRAGLLQKAYEFISNMPMLPSAIIWRTLLGACSIHGNVELAEQVKQRLSELEPDDSGDHVLLSNIYATAGKWKATSRVRKVMKSKDIKKTPGWSAIEVDRVMYSFVAREAHNEVTRQASKKLKEIIFRLKVEGGYVPMTKTVLYDVEDEEKEHAVSRHSEKLAVAYGLLRMCEGKTIRVVKNLRICCDCHTVMSLISKIYKVAIVVRDRSRFHSFKDGTCSCKGYW